MPETGYTLHTKNCVGPYDISTDIVSLVLRAAVHYYRQDPEAKEPGRVLRAERVTDDRFNGAVWVLHNAINTEDPIMRVRAVIRAG